MSKDPSIEICLDYVPKNVEELRHNIKRFYDVCHKVFPQDKYPEAYYTKEEIEELKNNPELREKMGITFI